MRFDYLEAKTIDQAISLLGQYDGRAKIIAGGTDLLLKIRNKAIKPEYVIDIGSIPGLDYIKYDDKQGLAIGALTTIRSLETSRDLQRRYPVLCFAASQLGSVAIRNMGTIGGNLCNAAPSAEMAPALIGLSARAMIVGPGGERVVPLEDFFTGPGITVLGKGELLTEIQVPVPEPNAKGVYFKHSSRGSIDLAIVGVAVVATLDGTTCQDIKILLGAVGPTPIRAWKAEKVLRGKKVDDALIKQSAAAAAEETCCISDVRASAEYRQEMAEVFTRRVLKAMIA